LARQRAKIDRVWRAAGSSRPPGASASVARQGTAAATAPASRAGTILGCSRYSTGKPICASASAVSKSGNPITPE
jgi:hypothetical protein